MPKVVTQTVHVTLHAYMYMYMELLHVGVYTLFVLFILPPSLSSRNAGMTHALGSSDWRELFDVVIVQAMKPSFYSNSDRLESTSLPLTCTCIYM